MKKRVLELIEGPACRLVGCTSIFARWFEWPHREVCSRIVNVTVPIHPSIAELKNRNRK